MSCSRRIGNAMSMSGTVRGAATGGTVRSPGALKSNGNVVTPPDGVRVPGGVGGAGAVVNEPPPAGPNGTEDGGPDGGACAPLGIAATSSASAVKIRALCVCIGHLGNGDTDSTTAVASRR